MGKKFTIHDKYKNNYFGSDDMELLYQCYPDPWRFSVDGHDRYVKILSTIAEYAGQRDLASEMLNQEDPPLRGIFEAGCGEGVFTRMLASAYPKTEVFGCDISKTAINRAQERAPKNSTVRVLDLGKDKIPLEDDSVSVIVLGDVLYYLRNNEEVDFCIAELDRILVDSGMILLTEFLRTKKYSNMVGEHFAKKSETRENVHFKVSPMDGAKNVDKTYRYIIYQRR